MPGSPTLAVATPERNATDAAIAAAEAGGNALDAALAAAVSLAVTYPHNCGIGGDLFAVVRFPDGRAVSVNASGPAALATDAAGLRRRYGRMPQDGVESITVPGAVAGWGSLHALGAKLSWTAAFDHAIRHAKDGVPVTPSLSWALGDAAAAIEADAGMAAVFGGAPGLGARLRQPALAATLERIAARGWSELYEGETGRRVARFLQASGSRLDHRDLARFAVEETPPLTGRFRGLTLLTSPPNASGVLLLQALAALEDDGDDGDWLGADAGHLALVLRAGAAQRSRMLADPRTHPFDADAWLDPRRLAELSTEGRCSDPAAAGAPPTGDTVAVVAADGDGLAVSLIQSLFSSMGSRVLDPETGVLLHNRGALFTLEPGHPNELAGGKRPAHTLLPVVVERDGALAGVLGTMGGNAHAQILAQVLLELLSGSSAAAAVAAPRWVVGALDPDAPDTTVTVESAVSPDARRSLAAAGLAAAPVEWPSEEVGHAQAVWHDGEALTAGSDPRADGHPARHTPGR